MGLNMSNLVDRVVHNHRWRKLRNFYDRSVHNRPRLFTVRYNKLTGPYRLCLRLADGPGMRQRLCEGTETAERYIFLPLLQKGWICGDIGAHVGDYTVEMAMLVGPQGKVYAYEVVPHYYELLKRGIEANGLTNVVPRLALVGATPGTVPLPVKMLPRDMMGGAVTDVPRVRLDDEIPRLNAIKIDCEGYEVDVLKGMTRLIAENRGLLLFLEVHNRQLPEAGSSLEELANLLLAVFQFRVWEISYKHCLCSREPLRGSHPEIKTVEDFCARFEKS